jgi:2-desacetyl-2-hydroxyethyl bacteriochlorophyllide A dehydrogenase
MQTIILNEPGDLRHSHQSDIEGISKDEALVKIKRIGICGTDYHAFNGKQPFFSYPRVLGHELGAEVVGLGSSQFNDLIKIGDKVSIEPYLSCNECQACKRGLTNCCENLQVLGVHTDGGMAEYLKLPMNKLHVSNSLTYDQLALVETLGIGLHAVNRAQVKPIDIVLIIGAGPIGISAAQFAKISGAHVVMADFNEQRLHFSLNNKLVDQVIHLTENINADQLKEKLNGDLPTVIFDATGNKASMENCFNFVAQGSKIVFIGLFQGNVEFVDPNFHRREVTLMSSRNSLPSDFKQIIKLMEKGKITTEPWLTHRSTFDQLPETFKSWLNPDEEVIKAIVSLD